MKMSKLFSQTMREAPAGTEVVGHAFLLRAGFVRQLAAGIFTYLHLGQRSLQKIEAILREEINGIGGQEVLMPVVHPASIWQESERWYQVDDEMGRFLGQKRPSYGSRHDPRRGYHRFGATRNSELQAAAAAAVPHPNQMAR